MRSRRGRKPAAGAIPRCGTCHRVMGDDEEGVLTRLDGKPLFICLDCAKKHRVSVPALRAHLDVRSGDDDAT